MKRWQVMFLIIGAVLFCAGLGVIRYYIPYDLNSELAAARAQGIPTSFSEMKRPPVPPSQDAAADYERAWAIQRKHDFTEHESDLIDKLGFRRGVTPAEAAELRRAFRSHADYVSAINTGASKPHWTHISKAELMRDYESNAALIAELRALTKPPWADRKPDGPIAESGLLQRRSREAAKIVRAEGGLLLREGHPVESARITCLIYNIGQQINEHPSLMGLIYATAIDGYADAGLKDALVSNPPNAELARVVRDAAGRTLDLPDLHRALMGEVAFETEWRPSFQSKEWLHTPLKDRVMYSAGYAADTHWMVRLVHTAETPEPNRRAALQAVADELKKGRPLRPAVKDAAAFVYQGADAEDRCLYISARQSVLYAGACVLEYRARTGRYPAKLEDAVKPVPVDPFDLKPLTYRSTAKGFEVMSGAGHARWTAESDPRAKDMVFTYPKA